MKRLIALPALALAAVCIADPAFAATKKKPAATTTGSVAAPARTGPPWAQKTPGNPHTVHGYKIRSENDATVWPTKHVVTVHGESTDLVKCKWTGSTSQPTDPLTLDGAEMFLESDGNGKYWLYLMTGDNQNSHWTGNNLFVKRLMTPMKVGDDTVWLKSDPPDGWNIYVFFTDTTSTTPKQTIDKFYHIEIFPPQGSVGQDCENERPPGSIKIATSTPGTVSHPCQTGSGSGGEPNH